MVHWHAFIGFTLGMVVMFIIRKLWDYIFEETCKNK